MTFFGCPIKTVALNIQSLWLLRLSSGRSLVDPATKAHPISKTMFFGSTCSFSGTKQSLQNVPFQGQKAWKKVHDWFWILVTTKSSFDHYRPKKKCRRRRSLCLLWRISIADERHQAFKKNDCLSWKLLELISLFLYELLVHSVCIFWLY